MDAVSALLAQGVRPAADLRRELNVSPATLMRRVQHAGPDVVRIGRGRATRYGRRQAWPGIDASRFPVFRVDEGGHARSAGELLTLAAREVVWMPDGIVSRGVPVELADARPSGFLGQIFATTHTDLRLPLRPGDWSDHHVLLALARRGEDLPGHFLVGDESFARWQALDWPAVTRGDYPALAEAAIAGHAPGSSAGGDRPKFGAFVEGRHVLVKFAARGGAADVVARRWCDLLRLEALALEVIASHGVPAARAQLVESSSHFFLEVDRFDRVGRRGRCGVLSLAAVHDDLADPWARAAVRLRDTGRLSAEDVRHLQWLDAFGALIANTDRHQYNVAFFTDGWRLRLAPAFDQAPMFYAPAADGQVLSRRVTSPVATADTLEVWEAARAAARELWQRAGEEALVSDDIRRTAADHAGALAAHVQTV